MIDIKGLLQKIKNSSLFKDSFWAVLGSALGKGLSLLAGIYVARFLGSDVYGEYGMIKTTLIYIAIFSTFGLGYTATKFIAENVKDGQNVLSVHKIVTRITYITSFTLAALVFILAKPLATYMDGPHLYVAFRITAIAIVFNALTTTQIGELSGFKDFKTIAKNNTYAGIVTFLLSVGMTYKWHFDGSIIALTISLGFNYFINYLSINKRIKSISSNNIEHITLHDDTKEILKFSFPVALQESLYSVVHWMTMAIMVKYANYSELGISSACSQWNAVILFIPGALRNVALSYLSESNKDNIENKKILYRLLGINFVATFMPFLIVLILSSWISSWYGSSYDGIRSVLNVSIFTTIVTSASNVITNALMSCNYNWYLFVSRLIRDVSILLFGALSIIYFGHAALTMAIITLIFSTVYLFIIFYKEIKVLKFNKSNC